MLHVNKWVKWLQHIFGELRSFSSDTWTQGARFIYPMKGGAFRESVCINHLYIEIMSNRIHFKPPCFHFLTTMKHVHIVCIWQCDVATRMECRMESLS